MDSKRQQKFSRLIQKDMGEIFQKHATELLEGAWVTVTEVKMSPDLGVASIYISFMLAKDKEELLKKINKNKSELRKHLGNRIRNQVRKVPELIFYVDNSLEHSANIEKLLSGIEIPKDDKINPDDYEKNID